MTNDRPQDVGRSHERTEGRGSPDAALVEQYQRAMRDEMVSLLGELRGRPAAPGLLDEADLDGVLERPALKDRAALWDLAIKLGRELGAAIDPDPQLPNGPPVAPVRRRTRKLDL